MSKSYGEENIDDSIERDVPGIGAQFLLGMNPTYETTDGTTHTDLEEAREHQRDIDRDRD
jgi:hypothetical protein